MTPNLFAFLRVAGLRLKAVVGDPLRGDVFVLHLVTHFVADVGIGTCVRGSAVSAFCDRHVVDILSVTVRWHGCANGCSMNFSPVGLLWTRHPGKDAKRPLCHCCPRHLVFRARNLNFLKAAIGVQGHFGWWYPPPPLVVPHPTEDGPPPPPGGWSPSDGPPPPPGGPHHHRTRGAERGHVAVRGTEQTHGRARRSCHHGHK